MLHYPQQYRVGCQLLFCDIVFCTALLLVTDFYLLILVFLAYMSFINCVRHLHLYFKCLAILSCLSLLTCLAHWCHLHLYVFVICAFILCHMCVFQLVLIVFAILSCMSLLSLWFGSVCLAICFCVSLLQLYYAFAIFILCLLSPCLVLCCGVYCCVRAPDQHRARQTSWSYLAFHAFHLNLYNISHFFLLFRCFCGHLSLWGPCCCWPHQPSPRQHSTGPRGSLKQVTVTLHFARYR